MDSKRAEPGQEPHALLRKCGSGVQTGCSQGLADVSAGWWPQGRPCQIPEPVTVTRYDKRGIFVASPRHLPEFAELLLTASPLGDSPPHPGVLPARFKIHSPRSCFYQTISILVLQPHVPGGGGDLRGLKPRVQTNRPRKGAFLCVAVSPLLPAPARSLCQGTWHRSLLQLEGPAG